MTNLPIKSVVCTRAGVAGEFAVVQLVNDQYVVTINGDRLGVFTWHAGQLSECTDFMVHLSTCAMTPALPARAPSRPLPVPKEPYAAA